MRYDGEAGLIFISLWVEVHDRMEELLLFVNWEGYKMVAYTVHTLCTSLAGWIHAQTISLKQRRQRMCLQLDRHSPLGKSWVYDCNCISRPSEHPEHWGAVINKRPLATSAKTAAWSLSLFQPDWLMVLPTVLRGQSACQTFEFILIPTLISTGS